jgi:class 3 adenylate cyclase/alpha-beta hydrolase superfamily lysophospholipase
MAAMPRTQYAKSGELAIAYNVTGDGPIDVVFVPGFVSHLELAFELPNLADVAARLGSFARVITFDKRGTGLSDRTAALPTLAERMDDIRAVMDAAGCERAAVIGMSDGAPAAAMFAATYPERVTSLVLWVGGLPPPVSDRGDAAQATFAFIDEYLGEHWGDGTTLQFLIGTNAPTEPAVLDLFSRFERNAATPTAAQAIVRRGWMVDCRPIRSAIGVPTLVVGHTNDPITNIAMLRESAAGIAGATMIETDAPGHWSWDIADQPDLDHIEEFLTGGTLPRPSNRKLVTVLYTDIVGSTERAVSMGDQRWRELLDHHDALTRRELTRYRGREVNTTGDGFVAAFDGPARAVECAQAIVHGATVLGLDLRAGIHTGECQTRGDDLAGVTMHVGARVVKLAGSREVIVSSTVRDIVDGADIAFEPRGQHELKGLPGAWELFAVTP